MIKTAIFVEGQTELIFTRELILKFFEYQNVWIECYNLFNNKDLNPTEYSFPNKDADFYFQILNIGNDQKVISSILKREKYLFGENQKFDKIIGLRDMYSKEYRAEVKNSTIDLALNQKFITEHQKSISTKSNAPEKINFHFAIMELESWLLGIENLFQKLNPELDYKRIKENCQIDLAQIDPENEIFHPADLVNRILMIVGDSYDKKKDEVEKIMGKIEKQDFKKLLDSDKCNSFNHYCSSIEIA